MNDYPDKKEQLVGWTEAVQGFGFIAGPIIGSTLYTLFGYKYTFIIYGSAFVILAFIINVNFPGSY